MDGLLKLEGSKPDQFKRFVSATAASCPEDFEDEYQAFQAFYREVRNPLVHDGKSYDELGRHRRTDLIYLQSLIGRILTNLAAFASEDFKKCWERYMLHNKNGL
jgi:hypothetical protein